MPEIDDDSVLEDEANEFGNDPEGDEYTLKETDRNETDKKTGSKE
jgi:hypothetical protein